MHICKNNIGKTLLIILILGIYNQCNAQFSGNEDEDIERKGTMFVGGSLSLMLGSITFLDFSPHYGYYLTDRLSIAGGLTGAYYGERYQNYTFKTYIYGGRAFARYDVFKQFFVHAEIEALNIENNSFLTPTINRKWLYSPLMGIGYKQKFSELSGGYLLLLWNFDESMEYPYGNPIIRFGFDFGWGKK